MQREMRGIARDHRHRNQKRKVNDIARAVSEIVRPLPPVDDVIFSTVQEGKTSTGAHSRRARLAATDRTVEIMAYQAHSVQKVVAVPRAGECPKETMVIIARALRENGISICFKKPERRMQS
jgi:hypothetical protein